MLGNATCEQPCSLTFSFSDIRIIGKGRRIQMKKIAHLLGTNQHDKKFTDFFECNFSDKTLYLKTADILELTDTQLYNWILILRIKDDFYKNKLSYLRDYMPIEDSDRLDYMITSNKANLEIQPFDDLFFNGINNENKTKIKKYLEK